MHCPVLLKILWKIENINDPSPKPVSEVRSREIIFGTFFRALKKNN